MLIPGLVKLDLAIYQPIVQVSWTPRSSRKSSSESW